MATSSGGNFWKRWADASGKPAGIEFRPLKLADYGYPDDLSLGINWTVWVAQTLATLKLDVKRGVLLLVVAMLLNDFVRPKFKDGIGASFVWNMQTGYNTFHWLRSKNKWCKYAAWVGLGVDVFAIGKEQQMGFDFNELVATDVHAAALAVGAIYGYLEKRFLGKR